MFTLPNLLSGLRLCLAPLLVLVAWSGKPKLFFLCLIASLLTDMADGFLARKLNQISRLGAKLDSWADFATYIALPFCGWWLRPDVVREEGIFLAAGISTYLAATIFGFLKFGRLTSYHTWVGKVAAVLVGGIVLILFAGGPGWPFRLVMPIVALAELEELAMTALLSTWQTDVPTIWHAMKIRQQTAQARLQIK